MHIINTIRLRGNVYLVDDLGDIKKKLGQLINRRALYAIGYEEEREEDKIALDEMEKEVSEWLDKELHKIPVWTPERSKAMREELWRKEQEEKAKKKSQKKKKK